MSHTVLVTAVGGNVGQGVLKALRAGNRTYRIVGIDMEPLSAGFWMTDVGYAVPRTGAPDFLDRIGHIIGKERIEAVYVCSSSELEFFSSQKDHLERKFGATVLVNPPEVVRIGSDKLATALFLCAAKLPCLQTCLATDNSALEGLVVRCGFPLIAKPRLGARSRDVFTVNSLEQLRAVRELVPDLIVQEFLPAADQEFTASTLSGPDGRVRAIIVLHRDLIQGTTYRTELVEDVKLCATLIEVVEKLGAKGACNVQFRMRDGQPFVFEVNPRFSGTSGIRFRYGFNDAEMSFELFRLGEEVQQPTLRPAVVMRYWDEVLVRDASFATLRGHAHDVRGYGTFQQQPDRKSA
jgi:carbamoyl-phosphate synthase large subunit